MVRGNNAAYALFSLGLIAAAGAVYTAAIGWLWFRQERLLFEPTRLAPDCRLTDDPDVHELWIDVPGARLSTAQFKRQIIYCNTPSLICNWRSPRAARRVS